MQLDDTQKSAIRDLVEKLSSRVSRGKSGRPVEELKGPVKIQLSNTFGLLGPRGAGKSTILSALYEAFRVASLKGRHPDYLGDDALLGLLGGLDDLIVLKPFDCSLVSREFPPGAATLLHLERELTGRGKAEGMPPSNATIEGLHDLVERYSKGSDKFETLAMELASSAGEYTYAVTEAARERFLLRGRLCEWLGEALRELEKSAFVLLLDDFDLVHGQATRNWFSSLLDELFQEQLLIVLTADFYRLEHLIWDPSADVDDMTGRHLLNKLLPVQNRVDLEEWSWEDRRRFKLFGEEDLEKIVSQFPLNGSIQELLVKALLPGWPRGLLNLFSRLTAEKAQAKGALPSLGLCRRLLSALASCRGEPLLARELMLRPLESWAATLELDDMPVGVEEWNDTVDVACERGKGRDLGAVRPISILKPKEQTLQRDPEERSSSARDTLRHDVLRERPLKDSEDRWTPLWVELLLSFGLSDREAAREAARNRVRLASAWPPVASRLSRARFRFRLSRQEQRSFFEDHKVTAAALLWFRWEDGIDSEVSIGWEPLLSALRGERSIWQSEAIKDLLIDPRRLEGVLPLPGEPASLDLLPDQVWAIILLADGLDRCPWEALSLPLGWEMRTQVVLAILLVRTAYVYALELIGESPGTMSAPQRTLLEALKSQNPVKLLKMRDADVLDFAGKMLDDKIESKLGAKKKKNPIDKAALRFLKSEPYQVLRYLVTGE